MADDLPVVATVSLAATAGRDLVGLLGRPQLRLRLAGCQASEDALAELGRTDDSSVVQATILSLLLRRIPRGIDPALIAAALIGIQPVSVRQFARACALSERSLHRRFAQASYPHPRVVLKYVLALRTVWLFERERLPLKQIASRLGTRSPEALTNSVRRFTGYSVRGWISRGGFEGLLAEFGAHLSAPGHHRDCFQPGIDPIRSLWKVEIG